MDFLMKIIVNEWQKQLEKYKIQFGVKYVEVDKLECEKQHESVVWNSHLHNYYGYVFDKKLQFRMFL